MLICAKRSLEILTTCSVSSVTSGKAAIPLPAPVYLSGMLLLKCIWLIVPQEYCWGGVKGSKFQFISVAGGKNSLSMCVHRDLMSWINGMRGLVSSDELAKDVTGAEALLERHQVCER